MPGVNLTGKPSTKNYKLGRGSLYIAPLGTDDLPLDGGERNCGNVASFNVSAEVETLEHQSTQEGLAEIDVEVIRSRKQRLSFELEEVSDFDNMALFLFGDASTGVTNSAVAGFAEWLMEENVVLGRWYPIRSSTGVRAYNITLAASVTAEKDGAPDVLLVEGTDYELDLVNGMIFLLSSATNIAAGDDMNITLAASAGAGTLHKITMQTASSAVYQVRFVPVDPLNNDVKVDLLWHKVQLAPQGDFGQIGEDWSKQGFQGTSQKSAAASHSASPYGEVIFAVGQLS